MERNLQSDAESALKRWKETKAIGFNNLDKHIIILAASEIEGYLERYIQYHNQAKRENRLIERRRQDHWDILNKKCSEDPMFKEMWDDLLILLKLENSDN